VRLKGGRACTVFLLDDHNIVRQGLLHLLAPVADIEVIGESGTMRGGLSSMTESPPDVALIDLNLPDGDGAEVCRRLRSQSPQIRCLILTGCVDDAALARAILAGADGVLLKTAPGPAIVDSIRKVAEGESLLDPIVTRRVLDELRGHRAPEERQPRLTKRHQELLELLADGLTNREIAGRLHLAEKTVRNYISELLTELGMRHRTEAALYAAHRKRPRRDS
jgi:two-component system, NarL family, response regulator DevR